MTFPKLDESPIVNLSLSGPYVRYLSSFRDRATLAFERISVVSAGGGVQLSEGVDFQFDFDRGEPEVYRLTVDQPFEPDGPSRRPPSAGGYRLQLPWWMLQPLMSVPARSTIQLEFTETAVDLYVTPH